jgi:hypothetical protein
LRRGRAASCGHKRSVSCARRLRAARGIRLPARSCARRVRRPVRGLRVQRARGALLAGSMQPHGGMLAVAAEGGRWHLRAAALSSTGRAASWSALSGGLRGGRGRRSGGAGMDDGTSRRYDVDALGGRSSRMADRLLCVSRPAQSWRSRLRGHWWRQRPDAGGARLPTALVARGTPVGTHRRAGACFPGMLR